MTTEKLPDNGHKTSNTTFHAPDTIIACPDKVSKTSGTAPVNRAAVGNCTENCDIRSSLSITTQRKGRIKKQAGLDNVALLRVKKPSSLRRGRKVHCVDWFLNVIAQRLFQRPVLVTPLQPLRSTHLRSNCPTSGCTTSAQHKSIPTSTLLILPDRTQPSHTFRIDPRTAP